MKKNLLPLLIIILFYTCSPNNDVTPPDNTNYTIPTVSIVAISDVTEATANSGGNVTNDGGKQVTAKGLCWSTITNPDVTDNKTNNGSGTGSYISQLVSLAPETKYYVRAYATNSEGTAYSNELSFTTTPSCYSGVYNGSITLSTQQEVNDFGSQCYIGVSGILQIGDYLTTTDEIIDLSSLSTLVTIGGSLYINSNTMLTSLDGLEGITSVYNLDIAINQSLVSISALSNLEEITGSGVPNNGNGVGVHIRQNEVLTTLDGLEKITILGGLEIYENPLLNSIQGLNNLTKLYDQLYISSNNLLSSLEGLNNLTSIGTFCRIQGNPNISTLDVLMNLTSIGTDLYISANNALTSLVGLNNINNVDNVFIKYNLALTSLVGLPNLSAINIGLSIDNNNALPTLEGIEGTVLSGGLGITNNSNLTTLSHLTNLTSIGGHASITSNNSIISLDGLENLIFVDGWFQIGNNQQLTDFCALTNLFTNGSITQYSIIQDNAYNPSEYEIQNGNCSQ